MWSFVPSTGTASAWNKSIKQYPSPGQGIAASLSYHPTMDIGWQVEFRHEIRQSFAQCSFITSQFYQLNSSKFGLSFPHGILAGKTLRTDIEAGLQCSKV
jgi:hypothetical protein